MECFLCVAGGEMLVEASRFDGETDSEPDEQPEDCDDPQVVDHEWVGVAGGLVRKIWTVRVVVEVIP